MYKKVKTSRYLFYLIEYWLNRPAVLKNKRKYELNQFYGIVKMNDHSKLYIQDYEYNGFSIDMKHSICTSFYLTKFINWTNDPGVAIFSCNDNKERAIPTCVILDINYVNSLPKQTYNNKKLVFGFPSSSFN